MVSHWESRCSYSQRSSVCKCVSQVIVLCCICRMVSLVEENDEECVWGVLCSAVL
jgi:hypothetical protein